MVIVDGAHEARRRKKVTFLTLHTICSHLAAPALIVLDSGWITADVSNFPKVKELLSGINKIDKLDRGRERVKGVSPDFSSVVIWVL